MVENFLLDLFRRTQKQKIAVIIDGGIISKEILYSLPHLTEKLREVGDIKIAEVIYESKIPDSDYEHISEAGFTDIVVSGNLDLNFLIESYDLILSDKSIDMIVLGTNRENLIPLFSELRRHVTVLGLVSQSTSKAFEESFDGIIDVKNIDEFNFSPGDISEIETLTGQASYSTLNGFKEGWIEPESDANIGTISEDLEEQTDLEKELIKEAKANGSKSMIKDPKKISSQEKERELVDKVISIKEESGEKPKSDQSELSNEDESNLPKRQTALPKIEKKMDKSPSEDTSKNKKKLNADKISKKATTMKKSKISIKEEVRDQKEKPKATKKKQTVRKVSKRTRKKSTVKKSGKKKKPNKKATD